MPFNPPFITAVDDNGNTLSGALLQFYVTGTTTPATVYTTSALNVAHSNPVVADSAGRFAPIYLDPDVTYRAVLKTAGGATIKDIDPASNDLVAALDAAHLKVGSGGLYIDGGLTSGQSLPRDDAAIAITAPVGEHALILFAQQDRTDECAITFHMPSTTGTYYQYGTIFNALYDGDCGFTGFHGEIGPAGDDNTPLIVRYDNSVQVCGGSTGTAFWLNTNLTAANYFHNFQKSHLQGVTVMGDHSQTSLLGGSVILEANGQAFFGTVDGTTKASTVGLTIGYSAGAGYSFIQAYNYNTSAFSPLVITGSTVQIASSGQSVGFMGATPVTRPAVSGSRGGNAALASLLTALANLGLITDSSSA